MECDTLSTLYLVVSLPYTEMYNNINLVDNYDVKHPVKKLINVTFRF